MVYFYFTAYQVTQLNTLYDLVQDVTNVCSDIRLCSTIHVEGVRATGTACSGSNIWPLVTTWLQRSVDYGHTVLNNCN